MGLCEKLGVIRRAQSCSSESCHFNDWFVKLPKISRRIYVSRVQPSELCRKRLKPTWLDCLKTRTFALSMQNVLQLCRKTFNWPEELEGSVPKIGQNSSLYQPELPTTISIYLLIINITCSDICRMKILQYFATIHNPHL